MITLLIAYLKRCLQRASGSLPGTFKRLLSLLGYIFRLQRGSRTPSDHPLPPVTEKHSFIAAMALPEQLLSPPDANRSGTPSLAPISFPVSSDHAATQADTRSVQDNQPNVGPSPPRYLSPPSPNVITQTPSLPSPSSPSVYRPYSIHSNRSAQSVALSVVSTRPPSMRSMDSRRSRYRKHNGSRSAVHVERYQSTVALANDASRATVSYQLQSPSHNQPLLATGGRVVAPPPDGQGSSILTGTTNVAGMPETVSDEESFTLNIDPMLPDGLKRYEHRSLEEGESDYSVPCMTAYYPDHESEYPHRQSKPVPKGWQRFLHPEGAVFYYNVEMRTFTDVDVCDEDVEEDVMFYAEHFRQKLGIALNEDGYNLTEHQRRTLECQSILVVEPQLNDVGDDVIIRYYFVNPDGRSVFWLHDMDYDFFGISGVKNMTHKKIAITAHYWKHWDMYPVHCFVDETLVQNVKNIILHAKCDQTTSRFPAGPLSSAEMSDFLSILSGMKVGCAESSMHVACALGRIMFTITYNQYINFHGQPCARLNSNDSVYGWKYQPSPWMRVGSWLLFRAPNSYVTVLHDIYVDDIANKHTWRDFITELNTQLQDFNLLATVLLNANVGFLAIQSVDGSAGAQRSWTQIASYWSLTSSIGSIILGTILVRFHQGSVHNDAKTVAGFLQKMYCQKRGLERLAVVYSLPYALLMWGIVAFFSAFAIESCQKGQRRDLIAVGTVFGITFTLIVYSIWSIFSGSCSRGILERVSSITLNMSRNQKPETLVSDVEDQSITSTSKTILDRVKSQWSKVSVTGSSRGRSGYEETAQDFGMTPIHPPQFTFSSPEERHQSHRLPLHYSRGSPT